MLDQVNTRVPAEFIGLARAFRNEVRATDIQMDKALATICKPLKARLARTTKLRAAMLPDFGRSYQQSIPERYRIGTITAARDRVEFAITETRLVVSWLIDDAWNNPGAREQGVTICKFTLYVRGGKLRQYWTPLCNVSLHAIGRRLERGCDRSSEALTRDLARLAEAGDDGERVDTEGGFWLGSMTNASNSGTGNVIRIRNVRTWFDNDG